MDENGQTIGEAEVSASKEAEHARGVDELGRIINLSATSKIPNHYRAAVDDAVQSALRGFPGEIHSMYIYGSVPRGTARPGESDLDVSALLYDEPTAAREDEFAKIAQGVVARHPIITKLDYDVGGLLLATSPEQRYGWHYWLKCCSANLWGEDITLRMEPHVPCLELAHGINGDIASRVDKALRGLTEENVKERSSAIAKKLARTAYSLIAAEDRSWHTDIQRCAAAFVNHHPGYTEQMALLVEIAINGASVATLRSLLDGFGREIIELFELNVAGLRK